MFARDRIRSLGGASEEPQNSLEIDGAALDEQALGGETTPAVRVVKRFNERFVAGSGQRRAARRQALRGADSPDAPAGAAGEVIFLLNVIRQRKRSFDDLAVEV